MLIFAWNNGRESVFSNLEPSESLATLHTTLWSDSGCTFQCVFTFTWNCASSEVQFTYLFSKLYIVSQSS